MQRRHFLQLGSLALAQSAAARSLSASSLAAQAMQMGAPPQPPPGSKADITLRIAPVTVELSPDRILSTIGYKGTSPGPDLRSKEGKKISADVLTAPSPPELVHWHGLLLPPDMDGVEEQGTPFVPGSSNGKPGQRRYTF